MASQRNERDVIMEPVPAVDVMDDDLGRAASDWRPRVVIAGVVRAFGRSIGLLGRVGDGEPYPIVAEDHEIKKYLEAQSSNKN